MKSIAQFKALYYSGFLIPDISTVTSMSLLFEKVFLPNNINLIKEFSKRFRIRNFTLPPLVLKSTMNITCNNKPADPFKELNITQKETAYLYIRMLLYFSMSYSELFGEVFESNLFENESPYNVKLVKKGGPGKLNTYKVNLGPMILYDDEEEGNILNDMIESGYIPLVCKFLPFAKQKKYLQQATAKQLATLLAMQSIKMVLPNTKPARPEEILEARSRLKNHLPPFWSSMLKMSNHLKECIENCTTTEEIIKEGQDMVDTLVRPALIDLNDKLKKEREKWFYKILSPVQKGLKLCIGNPPVTQQQLMTNALILGSDVIMDTARNINIIETLKNEAGLTFLLELDKLVNKNYK